MASLLASAFGMYSFEMNVQYKYQLPLRVAQYLKFEVSIFIKSVTDLLRWPYVPCQLYEPSFLRKVASLGAGGWHYTYLSKNIGHFTHGASCCPKSRREQHQRSNFFSCGGFSDA